MNLHTRSNCLARRIRHRGLSSTHQPLIHRYRIVIADILGTRAILTAIACGIIPMMNFCVLQKILDFSPR